MKDDKINLEQLKSYQVSHSIPIELKEDKYSHRQYQQPTFIQQKPLDTPSTSYGVGKNRNKIHSVAQKHPHLHQPKENPIITS